MNNQYIKQSVWSAVYVVSPYSNSCFVKDNLCDCFEVLDKNERNRHIRGRIAELVDEGEVCLLPHRLMILQGQTMAPTSRSGRAVVPMSAQLKGTFIIAEDSPYKVNKPFAVQTGLWQVQDCKTIFQGSLGISGPDGAIVKDNGDLLLVRTSDWKTLQVYVFRGLAGVNKQLDYLSECVEYVKGIK